MLLFFIRFLQLCAELKQTLIKLAQVEQKVQTQAAECERQQQKVRELELELARNSTNRGATTSLQEELQAERARLIAADKKVSAPTCWTHSQRGSACSFCFINVINYGFIRELPKAKRLNLKYHEPLV